MLPFFGRCVVLAIRIPPVFSVNIAEATVRRPFTSGATVTPNRDSQVESAAVWDTAALPGGVWTLSVERPCDLPPVYERLGWGGPPLRGASRTVMRFIEAICLRTSGETEGAHVRRDTSRITRRRSH